MGDFFERRTPGHPAYGSPAPAQAQAARVEPARPFGPAGVGRESPAATRVTPPGFGRRSGGMGPNGDLRSDVLEAQSYFGGWRDGAARGGGSAGDAMRVRSGAATGGADATHLGWEAAVPTANAAGEVAPAAGSIGSPANEGSGAAQDAGDRFGFGAALIGAGTGGGFDASSELLGGTSNAASSAGSAIGGAAGRALDRLASW